MYRPTSKNVLVKVEVSKEEVTKSGIILQDVRTMREREAMNQGEVLAIGHEVTEVKIGDTVAFREGTYWKNDKRINPDEVEVGLYVIQERDILLIIEENMEDETQVVPPVEETVEETTEEVVETPTEEVNA